MKLVRLAAGLALANLALLVFLLARGGETSAAATEPVLRAALIELVDSTGTVRAQLKTEDDGQVVLRLRDQQGNIRVKLAAGALGSGLLLADETSEVGVHILSGISLLTGERDTKIALAEPDGMHRVIRPGASGGEP